MASDKRPDEMSAEEVAHTICTMLNPVAYFQEHHSALVALLAAWRGDRERDILALLNASPLFVGPNYAECAVCRRSKKPFGRSAPLASANGYCDSDCAGYGKPPHANSLWPGERREDYGYPEELANFARALREALN